MATADSILDKAQEYLHDPDAAIWTRAELLDYLNDGYRRALVQTSAARQLVALDVPPRLAWALTHPWERQYVSGGLWEWTWADNLAGTRNSYEWEAEQELGMSPTTSESTYTQPWERMHAGGATREEPERYAYPADHLQTIRIAFDDERVPGLSVRTLDAASPRWEVEDSTPTWYLGGLRREKEFALYPMASAYTQGVAITGESLGTAGGVSGERTYSITTDGEITEGFAYTTSGDLGSDALAGPGRRITTDTTVAADYQALYAWEEQHVEGDTPVDVSTYTLCFPWEAVQIGQAYTVLAGLGTPNRLSGERQYLVDDATNPGSQPLGTLGDWHSSEDSLLLDYALAAPTLAESDSPDLLPAPFGKYLRCYVLHRAFGREGEGRNTLLADHFLQRFQMGIAFLKRLASYAHEATVHQHGVMAPTPSRPGKPRLPATYPRIR